MSTHTGGIARPQGDLGLVILRGDGKIRVANPPAPLPLRALSVKEALYHGCPRPGLAQEVNAWRGRNQRNLLRGLRRVAAARAFQAAHVYGQLHLRVLHRDGTFTDLGLASMRVVTDTGVGYIVDAFQGTVEMEDMKFHGFGTGTTAEAASQTALVTELTTQYATNNIRPTGSQTEAAANIYRTVATLDPDSDVAITEHGLFSDADVAQGVMLDRSVFAAVNLVGATGDALQATYDFTVTSGG